MLRFQHSEYLWALVLIPVLVLLFVSYLLWRKKQVAKLGDQHLVKLQLLGNIAGRRTLSFILIVLSLFALILGWANLQSGGKAENVDRKGVDVMVALDVSKSMLATDIQPNRLTRAKQLITTLLDRISNDRVGLILFAGHAYQQVPLTSDYNAVKMFLQNANPGLVPTQGTVVSEAINMAVKNFSQKEKKYKALVIISDGEDHDKEALVSVKKATEEGVIIHTVGIGSQEGTTLMDPATGREKLDANGQPVISKLNQEELESIAKSGRGTYSLLNNIERVAQKLAGEIDGMEQRKLGVVEFTARDNYFQYFLLFGFVLLITEWFLPAAKKNTK